MHIPFFKKAKVLKDLDSMWHILKTLFEAPWINSTHFTADTVITQYNYNVFDTFLFEKY